MSSTKLLIVTGCILLFTLPVRTFDSERTCKEWDTDSSNPVIGDIPVPAGKNCRAGTLNYLCMDDVTSESFPGFRRDASLADSCKAMRDRGCNKSGLYFVKPGIRVFCDMNLLGGGWTLILRRLNGSQEFLQKNYHDYKGGFGDFSSNYWPGLNVVHQQTSRRDHELYIGMEDHRGEHVFARYDRFSVGDKDSGYKLSIQGFNPKPHAWISGGDSLSSHNGARFSAKGSTNAECGTEYGGWWYNSCGAEVSYSCNYMRWFTWTEDTELRSFVMYIREL